MKISLFLSTVLCYILSIERNYLENTKQSKFVNYLYEQYFNDLKIIRITRQINRKMYTFLAIASIIDVGTCVGHLNVMDVLFLQKPFCFILQMK